MSIIDPQNIEYATTASLVPDLEKRIVVCQNKLTMLMGKLPAKWLGAKVFHCIYHSLTLCL